MTFDEFKLYYQKYKKTPGMIRIPNHTLNEKELKSRYEKHCKISVKVKSKKPIKKSIKGTYEDSLWKETVDLLRKRDYNSCRLLSIINETEVRSFYERYPSHLISILDPAHVIPRSKSKKLYYELDNLVLLNRVSHSFLDSYQHPLYGTAISKQEHRSWWSFIIGEENLNRLEKMV